MTRLPPYTSTADGEWHYLHRGRVTHFRSRYGPGLNTVAACGLAPPNAVDWFGTGKQAEYERAAQLPKCLRCKARVQVADSYRRPRPVETVAVSGGLL